MTCCPACYTELLVTATGLECARCVLEELLNAIDEEVRLRDVDDAMGAAERKVPA